MLSGFFIVLITIIHITFTLDCPFGSVSNGSTCDECGVPDQQANVKIVGGKGAQAKSWPWNCAMKRTFRFNYKNKKYRATSLCGCSLIDRKTIVSAAHCHASKAKVQVNDGFQQKDILIDFKKSSESISFCLGCQNIKSFLVNDKADRKEAQIIQKVSQVYVHPEYDSTNMFNDIALIVLTEPVTLSSFIKPICLPRNESLLTPSINSDIFAHGWGTTKSGGQISFDLRNVKLKVLSSERCSSYPNVDLTRQLCVGWTSSGKDTCQGDSGSGIDVIDDANGTIVFVISGITSYGYGCALYKYPGVYTRVSAYLNWIKSYMIN